jgi:hypothetical protein
MKQAAAEVAFIFIAAIATFVVTAVGAGIWLGLVYQIARGFVGSLQ